MPRALFEARNAPFDVVVPACKPCNDTFRRSDQVAAVLARVWPFDPNNASEFVGQYYGLVRNLPEAKDELKPQPVSSLASDEDEYLAFVLSEGGVVMRSLQLFGAKVAIGVHYKKTGEVLPVGATLAASVYPNSQMMHITSPMERFLEALGEVEEFSQGPVSSYPRFFYRYRICETSSQIFVVAFFENSFSTSVMIDPAGQELEGYGQATSTIPRYLTWHSDAVRHCVETAS